MRATSRATNPSAAVLFFFLVTTSWAVFEFMDKKAKKKIDVLRTRLQKLEQQLAGSRKQMDDPADVARLEKEVASAKAELEKLKNE